MFLRNYDNTVAVHILNGTRGGSGTTAVSKSYINDTSIFGDGYANVRRADGTTGFCTYGYPIMSAGNVNGICLGDGTAEVTYEDYKLSGNVIENKLTLLSENYEYNRSTMKWKKNLIATYNNSSASAITISEWGFFQMVQGYSASAYKNNGTFILLSRELLDEPIVIEAGTTATLTFSIDVPMPNHP